MNNLQIYNIKEKIEYLPEIISLSHDKWSSKILDENEMREYIKQKTYKIVSMLDNNDYCKLILLKKDKLVGFISIFKHDGEYEQELTPWYATMYVKKEYRGNGYSKILNNAILEEATKRGFDKIYLKTDLIGYYEKFEFCYLKDLKNGEKLYFKKLQQNKYI